MGVEVRVPHLPLNVIPDVATICPCHALRIVFQQLTEETQGENKPNGE